MALRFQSHILMRELFSYVLLFFVISIVGIDNNGRLQGESIRPSGSRPLATVSGLPELPEGAFPQSGQSGRRHRCQQMQTHRCQPSLSRNGKRPRDLLNPKAIKYMHSIFSIKDAVNKKECRKINALLGVIVTQVREFFTAQRSIVRKFVSLSKEKSSRSNASAEVQDSFPSASYSDMPINPVPLNCLTPTNTEGPSCPTADEVLPDIDESHRNFMVNIFSSMRKEDTFSGQVNSMEWILRIQNPAVLYWFLTKDSVMILATWLSQSAIEEQTSVLHVILKVLCHLPLHKALPGHMSAILQSVNKLRFYRVSDQTSQTGQGFCCLDGARYLLEAKP